MSTDHEDARSQTSAENGKLGGIAKGTELPHRTTYSAEALAQAAANRILSGSPLVSAQTGPVTQDDRKLIARITGEPAEAFQARITAKLEAMADQTADLIFQTLKEEPGSKTAFRPDTLPSLMAIAIDKIQALSGRTASIGSVHLQVNNFNSSDRSSVLGNLKTLRGDKGSDVIPV